MKKQTRKNFLFTGLSLTALIAFFKGNNQPEKKKTVKFLTKDGKLVEIDIDKLPTSRTIASKEDVQNWISKK